MSDHILSSHAPRSGSRGQRRLPIVAIALATILIQLPIFDRWLSLMDEGHILQFADMIARGGDLYGDATVYPLPGAFWLLAVIFQLFDPSILLARWIAVIVFTLFVVLCVLLVRRLLTPAYTAVLVLILLMYRIWAFPHWHMYSYSTTALVLLLGSLLLLHRFCESGERTPLLAAGFFFGLGVLCKQDYGAAVLVTATVTLAASAYGGSDEAGGARSAHGLRWFAGSLAWFLVPAAAVGLLTGAYFLHRGVLADALRFTVFNHFAGIASFEYHSFPSLFPLFTQDPELRTVAGVSLYWPPIVYNAEWPTVLASAVYRRTALLDMAIKAFYYAPFAILAAGAARLWRRRGGPRQLYLRELTLYTLAATLTGLVWINKPQDYVHLIVLYWPLLALLIVYARGLFDGRPALALAVAAALVVPTAATVGYTYRLASLLRAKHSERLMSARAGIYVTPGQASTLTELLDFIEENSTPADTISVIPYAPILHFLSQRPGPHRSSYIVWPFAELADRDRRVVDAMEASGTDLVIYDFVQVPTFPRVESYAPELFAYLADNFTVERLFTGNEIATGKFAGAKRSPQQRAGTPIVGGDPASIGLYLASADASPRPVAPGDRSRYLSREIWPMRRVLVFTPPGPEVRTVASVPLLVPARARLRTAVGVHTGIWQRMHSAHVHFRLDVVDDRRRETVYNRILKPSYPDQRGWFDVDVALDQYAGKTVTLEFSVECACDEDAALGLGAWEQPRIFVGDSSDGDGSSGARS